MNSCEPVTITVRTLDTLLWKAQNAGWEVANRIKTEEQARAYMRNVVMELVDVDIDG